MKKKILLGLFMCMTIVISTACGSKKISDGKLSINCNGKESSIELKEDNTFKCNLLDHEYVFTIKSISDDEVIVYTPSTGLTLANENGSTSLTGKYNDFTIKKDKNASIYTQTTDYQEELVLYWK